MLKNTRIPFEADLRNLVIGPEAPWRLGDLIETARLHLQPRNFAEHYLVDEMALSKWRGMRAQIMEKAVYDRQRTSYKPRGRTDADGKPAEPFEDMYHLAMAHSADGHQIVMSALGRLETRYYRHFCSAFRLLLASRRGTPPPLPDLDGHAEASPSTATKPEATDRKEGTTCEH
jgi:hypothetical protein